MTFSIGRAGLDITLDPPQKVTDTGDKVTFEQPVQTCSSLNDVRYLQVQLLGMKNNPDEAFVPLVWTDDPSFTGYYRVANVEVGLIVSSLASFVFPWKVELERVSQYAQPSLQLISVGSGRTGISASAIDFYGVPTTTWTPLGDPNAPGGLLANETRVISPGVNQTWLNGVTGSNRGAQIAIPPADFYTGAARVEWTLDSGSTWRALVGRKLPNLPYAVRIINDLTTAGFSNSSTLDLSFTSYNGAGYGTAKSWSPCASNLLTAYPGAWAGVTVLRNSPSGAALRFVRGVNSGTAAPYSAFTMDIAMRPGACFITCALYDTAAGSLGIKRTTNEAGTPITNGLRATSNDASSGHRYVLASGSAITTDNTVGAIRLTGTSTNFAFMIGAEINGSAATGNATAANVVAQYGAATTQALRVIGQ